jgi:hypothetical protein
MQRDTREKQKNFRNSLTRSILKAVRFAESTLFIPICLLACERAQGICCGIRWVDSKRNCEGGDWQPEWFKANDRWRMLHERNMSLLSSSCTGLQWTSDSFDKSQFRWFLFLVNPAGYLYDLISIDPVDHSAIDIGDMKHHFHPWVSATSVTEHHLHHLFRFDRTSHISPNLFNFKG